MVYNIIKQHTKILINKLHLMCDRRWLDIPRSNVVEKAM
jgi:hypothetical protein